MTTSAADTTTETGALSASDQKSDVKHDRIVHLRVDGVTYTAAASALCKSPFFHAMLHGSFHEATADDEFDDIVIKLPLPPNAWGRQTAFTALLQYLQGRDLQTSVKFLLFVPEEACFGVVLADYLQLDDLFMAVVAAFFLDKARVASPYFSPQWVSGELVGRMMKHAYNVTPPTKVSALLAWSKAGGEEYNNAIGSLREHLDMVQQLSTSELLELRQQYPQQLKSLVSADILLERLATATEQLTDAKKVAAAYLQAESQVERMKRVINQFIGRRTVFVYERDMYMITNGFTCSRCDMYITNFGVFRDCRSKKNASIDHHTILRV